MIDAKTQFGIAADGTDETVAINAALTLAETEPVYLGPGIWAKNKLKTFSRPPMIQTAGRELTKFKNLSATEGFFSLEKHTATDLKTSWADFGGFSLDQNGSTGDGIQLQAQMSSLHDVYVQNQGGAGYGVNVNKATLAKLTNIYCGLCSNAMRIDAYYVNTDHIQIERTNGYGLRMENCAASDMRGMYFDNGSTTGSGAQELLKATNCHTINIHGMNFEIGSGHQIGSKCFFNAGDTTNFNVVGGYMSHTFGTSKYIFMTDRDLRIQGVEWKESRSAIIFAGSEVTGAHITLRDMSTDINITDGGSGSSHLVGIWGSNGGNAARVSVENIRHLGATTPAITVNAAEVYTSRIGNTPVVR